MKAYKYAMERSDQPLDEYLMHSDKHVRKHFHACTQHREEIIKLRNIGEEGDERSQTSFMTLGSTDSLSSGLQVKIKSIPEASTTEEAEPPPLPHVPTPLQPLKRKPDRRTTSTRLTQSRQAAHVTRAQNKRVPRMMRDQIHSKTHHPSQMRMRITRRIHP